MVTRTFVVDAIETIGTQESDLLVDSMFEAPTGDSSELESIDSYKPKRSIQRPRTSTAVAKKKVSAERRFKLYAAR